MSSLFHYKYNLEPPHRSFNLANMIKEILIDGYRLVYAQQTPVLAAILVLFAAYTFILHPFFISPLRHVPGPYLNRISSIPFMKAAWGASLVRKTHLLHAKYGDVVLLAPKMVACNGDPKYLHDIYTKNMPKLRFYENFLNHGNRRNIFSTLTNPEHLKLKKIIQNLYLKGAVLKNVNRQNLIEKVTFLMQDLRLNDSTPVDVFTLFAALAMDAVSGFEVGLQNSTDLLLKPEKRPIIASFRNISSMGFWTTRMPWFWRWAATDQILLDVEVCEKFEMALYNKAEANVPERQPNVNLTTLEALKKSGVRGLNAYSLLTDNLFAGHETTAVLMTYMCYQLSRPINRKRQLKLHEEIRNSFGPVSGDIIDDIETVDKLPYLDAVLKETMRVHAAIPGSEPRVCDKPYEVNINGKRVVIPAGTEISCQPYSMHRVELVFPQPDEWIPERWLQGDNENYEEYTARTLHMNKYMFPFGKGIRMCLGMNLALTEMKLACANMYWRYNSSIDPKWCRGRGSDNTTLPMGHEYYSKKCEQGIMAMADAYTTRPEGEECWLVWSEISGN